MKTIHTPLLTLAALAVSTTIAWSQDRPERDRNRGDVDRIVEEIQKLARDLPPEAQLRLEMRQGGNAEREQDRDRWRIGVLADPVDPLLRKHLKLPEDTGVVIDRVVEDSPAAEAGLEEGDIILAAGDRPIGSIDALREAVGHSANSGQPLLLWVLKDGEKKPVRITPPGRRDARERGRPDREVEERIRERREGMPMERMGRAMQEMRAQLQRQAEAIRRLERRLDEMERKRRD